MSSGPETRLHARRANRILAESIELGHTHRIKGPDGRRYVIKGYKKPDRIDALLEIDAQRVL